MNLRTIKKTLYNLLSIFFSLTIILIISIVFIIKQSNKLTKQLQYCNKLFLKYTPKTGDLVLLQYKSAGLYKYDGIKYIPSHCGLIFVQDNEIFVLEATKFDHIENYFINSGEKKVQKSGGVRLIKLSDLLSSIDNFLAIRPITSSIQINQSSLEWAKSLQFDEKISASMNMFTLFSVGICPMISTPHCSLFFSPMTNFHHQERRSVFCSEFITKLLQKEGHIKKEFNYHWTLSPIHFTSSVKTIDNLCSNLSWGQEILLIC
jgi:hypothetical protein